MSGTKIGSVEAVKTIYANYGRDHFARIGRIGGSRSTKGGYWYKKYVLGDIESIRRAGMLGGRLSRKGKKLSDTKRRQIRREYEKAYKELLAVHTKAQREREAYNDTAQSVTPRADTGAVTVFDRKRGLVRSN